MHDRFQTLRIIVIALAAGQLAFLAVAMLIQRSVVPPGSLDPTFLPIVATIVAMAAIATSVYLGRVLVARAGLQPDASARWTAFQSAVIVRMAFAEGSSFFQIVCYLLTGEWIFLLLFVASFGAFLFQRPAEDEWDHVRTGAR